MFGEFKIKMPEWFKDVKIPENPLSTEKLSSYITYHVNYEEKVALLDYNPDFGTRKHIN